MSAKITKLWRRIARSGAARKGWPETAYEERVLGRNRRGFSCDMPIRLAEECARKVYQTMKADYRRAKRRAGGAK